jgi:hypothetical protein
MKRRELLARLRYSQSPRIPSPFFRNRGRATPRRRLAILDDAPEATRAELWLRFKRRLAELGYVEGKNLTIVQRFADGDAERLPALANELVAWRRTCSSP